MSTDAPDLGYVSHFPALAGAIASIMPSPKYPILEFGCGHGSTHLIHLMRRANQLIMSADTDEKWLSVFAGYAGPNHEFHQIKAEVPKGSSGVREHTLAWLRWLQTVNCPITVAFVDCWPGEARVPIIQALKAKALAIVAHDLEADEPPGGGNYGWKKLDGIFKYHRVFKRLRPWTGFWSDHFDMPELE